MRIYTIIGTEPSPIPKYTLSSSLALLELKLSKVIPSSSLLAVSSKLKKLISNFRLLISIIVPGIALFTNFDIRYLQYLCLL